MVDALSNSPGKHRISNERYEHSITSLVRAEQTTLVISGSYDVGNPIATSSMTNAHPIKVLHIKITIRRQLTCWEKIVRLCSPSISPSVNWSELECLWIIHLKGDG